MAAFEYTAMDQRGKQQKGVLEADSARQIRQQLRDKGWLPTAVDPVAEKKTSTGSSFSLGGGTKLKSTELALVTRQLSTLIVSGLPLESCLRAVSQQSEHPRITSVMTAVRSRVSEGYTLANSLGDFPRAFNPLYRATVAAGEKSGHLGPVMERLADHTENGQALNQKIKLALVYPILLVLVAFTVLGVLLTYVVPQVVQAFSDSGQDLPGLTIAMLQLSHAFKAGWPYLIVGTIGGIFLFKRAMRKRSFRLKWHVLLLHTPGIKKFVRGADAARFGRTLSILAGAGVPLLEAMGIACEVLSNEVIRDAVVDATKRVREGTSLKVALEQTGYFPPMMLHMIASGEQSGELENMLERSAVNQERELETTIAILLGVFEPAMILVMGMMVALIVSAILLPIFELNTLVG
ncbi:type II secretion system inner membrane protein GspF [Pelagibaculum spongiae]|uniref:General secretion pathway protein F n=1 Tax=Pelagibaculum spongiae TaxID=2080658 RepID=A0A2V1GZP5_9GAMM|nr:type II secretion system inner membrane protein GspF [Pelagibaculum spongiae]PVZ67609.1 type II secretion system protein GspF [Pelagibaculum spongiae]